jgi:hypothetical protein
MLRIAVNLNRAGFHQGGFRKAAAQHSNRAHAGRLCGCNVIRRIADNYDLAGAQFHAAQRYVMSGCGFDRSASSEVTSTSGKGSIPAIFL